MEHGTLSQNLTRRIEQVEADDLFSHRGAMAALPGNPYGLELRRFGNAVAIASSQMPQTWSINRVIGGGAANLEDLQAGIDWVRSRSGRCRVDINPFDTNRALLGYLALAGFVTHSYQGTWYAEANALSPSLATRPGVTVQVARTDEELNFIATAKPQAFEVTDPIWVQWQIDSVRAMFGLPEWTFYIARVDGEPAGFALLFVTNGVGELALAGTLAPFRGRGVQTALIHRRIADARDAGCDLIVGQTELDSQSQHNMERAGLRLAYTRAEFVDNKPQCPVGSG